MSSNDGTRSTDAHESRLAHHFFPVSLNWLASRGGTFLGGMLSVNTRSYALARLKREWPDF